ncbi:MAG: hypothetical protein OEU46_00855 [Alphaproteobacteria bacterium]|nr:hypothetical protein [Alphaproteobacteria bacterium]
MPDAAPMELDAPIAAPPPVASEPPPLPESPEPEVAEPESPLPDFAAEPEPAPLPEFNAEPAAPAVAPPEPVLPDEPMFAADPAPPAADRMPAPPSDPVAAPEADAPARSRNIAAEFGATNDPPEMPSEPFPELAQEMAPGAAVEAGQPAAFAATEADAIAQVLADPPPLDVESPAPAGLEAEAQVAAPSAETAMDGFPPPPVAPPESSGDRMPVPPPRHSGRGATISLIILIVLVGGLGASAYMFQNTIVTWMPWSNSVYAMVGLKPDILGTGLQIIEPKPKKKIKGNDEILVVEGEIRNTSNHPLSLPLMRGALLGKDGAELHVWTFRADQAKIEPGELVGYKTEFRNPPGTAQKLDITFTRPGETGIAKKAPPDAKIPKEALTPRQK